MSCGDEIVQRLRENVGNDVILHVTPTGDMILVKSLLRRNILSIMILLNMFLSNRLFICLILSIPVFTSTPLECKVLQSASFFWLSVYLFVCLSVRSHISKATCLNFTEFSIHVTYSRGSFSFLTAIQYVMYFWFVDDVIVHIVDRKGQIKD